MHSFSIFFFRVFVILIFRLNEGKTPGHTFRPRVSVSRDAVSAGPEADRRQASTLLAEIQEPLAIGFCDGDASGCGLLDRPAGASFDGREVIRSADKGRNHGA
jgi:hypothetical protein